MARILSAYNVIKKFVEEHMASDEIVFFRELAKEVKGAIISDYAEKTFIDIIYGDYIFTAYYENYGGFWRLSQRVVLLAEDGSDTAHFCVDMDDIITE